MKAAALRGALSDRAANGRVHVVTRDRRRRHPFDQGGGRDHRAALRAHDTSWSCSSAATTLAWLSLRNLTNVHIVTPDQLNTYDVLVSDDVVFTAGGARGAAGGPGARQVGEGGRHLDRGRRSGGRLRRPPHDRRAVQKDPRDVLLKPVISEKSYGLLDENKYTFEVHPDANKTEIKIAVEKVFGVTVTSVNTLNRQGKRRRTRYGLGQAQGHQASHRQRRPRRPHRHLRRSGLLTGES